MPLTSSHEITSAAALSVCKDGGSSCFVPFKAASVNVVHSRGRGIEDVQSIRSLADELAQVSEQLDNATQTSLLVSGHDEHDSLAHVSFAKSDVLDSDRSSRFGDLSEGASTFTHSEIALLGVPSDCVDLGEETCDYSFIVDGGLSDDKCGDFSSESFFCEEESSGSSCIFNPDLLDDALHERILPDTSDASSAPVVTEDHDDVDLVPSVPVKFVWVCEHVFKAPTLRHRRLAYLRQMHVLVELGRAEAFDATRPIERPVLHAPRKPVGLARVAERGVVGGWADVCRPEPRYITHFRGRPELLFAEARAMLSGAIERTVLTVDAMRQYIQAAA
ncbi:hypothetical protein OH77DRAFT_1524889 [Trametes cingulata]|nr:hypothetical protein OH77DRAFT_1524889 [Trametes cingulata]